MEVLNSSLIVLVDLIKIGITVILKHVLTADDLNIRYYSLYLTAMTDAFGVELGLAMTLDTGTVTYPPLTVFMKAKQFTISA